MKSIKYTIWILILLSSCFEEEVFNIENEGSVLVNVVVPAEISFFPDDTQQIDFEVRLTENDDVSVSEVRAFKKLIAGGQESVEVPLTLANNRFVQNRQQLFTNVPIGGNPLSASVLETGDRWEIRYEITLSDGRELKPSKKTVINFKCFYDISGTYRANSVGFFGDGQGNQQDIDFNLTREIILTKLTDTTFVINDATFGLYPFEYLQEDIEEVLNFKCRDINKQFEVLFITQDEERLVLFDLSGSLDMVDRNIQIEWENSYGDKGTTILTKL